MTPMDTLLHQEETRPDRVAFIASESEWTYRHMADESERLAWALHARGVRCGDRVALHMANVPEIVVAYYACFRIGAIAAPLNIRLKAASCSRYCSGFSPFSISAKPSFTPRAPASIRISSERTRASSWAPSRTAKVDAGMTSRGIRWSVAPSNERSSDRPTLTRPPCCSPRPGRPDSPSSSRTHRQA